MTTFRQLLVIGLGGAVGAILRFLISGWAHHRWPTPFPIGTLTVNVIGCLVIGIMAQAVQASAISIQTRLLIVTGLLGSLTTFSTFGLETVHSVEQGQWTLALGNIAANVVIGLLAVSAGLSIGKLILG